MVIMCEIKIIIIISHADRRVMIDYLRTYLTRG